MQHFHAELFFADSLDDVCFFVVSLAENHDGTGRRLEIQRAFSFDAQDKMLGQDTYCLVTDAGATHYGGIESWNLMDGQLEIRLDKVASKALGAEGGFVITVNPGEQERLARAIVRVLGLE